MTIVFSDSMWEISEKKIFSADTVLTDGPIFHLTAADIDTVPKCSHYICCFCTSECYCNVIKLSFPLAMFSERLLMSLVEGKVAGLRTMKAHSFIYM